MINTVPPLEPGCPWYEVSQLAPPNVKWCEASQCSWITEPANTWSNLAYIVAAIVVYQIYKKHGGESLRRAAWYSFWIGVTSGVYHASYNFFSQIFDFFGMYLMGFLVLNQTLIRMGVIQKDKEQKQFWISVMLTTLLTILFKFIGFPYQAIVLALVVSNLVLEVRLNSRSSENVDTRYFWSSIGMMAVGITFSILDAKRIFCDPNNHLIQGHALWHVFVSVAFVFWALHIKQFKRKSFE